MSNEPNPPSRKEEDFPKTNTIPGGWVMDALVENGSQPVYDRGVTILDQDSAPVPTTGSSNGKFHLSEPVSAQETPARENDSLFSRRLEPFPSASDLSGMGL